MTGEVPLLFMSGTGPRRQITDVASARVRDRLRLDVDKLDEEPYRKFAKFTPPHTARCMVYASPSLRHPAGERLVTRLVFAD